MSDPELDQIKKLPWIKCSERMPEIGKLCLLKQTYPPTAMFNCRANPLPRNFIYVGGLKYDGKFISYEDQYSEVGLKYVSHWMPLPEPPND